MSIFAFLNGLNSASILGFIKKFFSIFKSKLSSQNVKKNMGEGNFSITVFDNEVINDKMFNMNYDLVSINDDKSFVYLKD